MSKELEQFYRLLADVEAYYLYDGWPQAERDRPLPDAPMPEQVVEQPDGLLAENATFLHLLPEKKTTSKELHPLAKIALEPAPLIENRSKELHTWQAIEAEAQNKGWQLLSPYRWRASVMIVLSSLEPEMEGILEYVTKWLVAIGLDAADAYITCVNKSMSLDNGVDEGQKNLLLQELRVIAPQSMILCGRLAKEIFLEEEGSIAKARLQDHFYQEVPLIITYEPRLIMMATGLKQDLWRDLQWLKSLVHS